MADTSNFKRDIAKLVAWFNGKKVSLEVDADTKAVEAKLKALERARSVTVNVAADTARARAEVERLARRRESMTLDVDVDPDRVRRQLNAMSNGVNSIRMPVEIDTEEIGRRLRDRSQWQDITIDVDADTALAVAQIRALETERIALQADVDTARAQVELERLERARQVELMAVVNPVRARAQLELLTRHRRLELQVDAVTALADARLAEATRDRRVRITPDIHGIATIAARLAVLTRDRQINIRANFRNNALHAITRGLNAMLQGFQNASTLVTALGAGVLKVGASIAQVGAQGVASFTSMFSEGTGAAARFFGAVSSSATEAGSSLSSFGAKMGEVVAQVAAEGPIGILKLVGAMALMATSAGAVSAAVGALVGVVSALLAAFLSLASALVGIVGLLGAMATAMAAAAVGAAALAAVPLLPMAAAALVAAGNMDELQKKFESAMTSISEKVKPAAQGLLDQFDKTFSGLGKWLDQSKDKLKSFFDAGVKFVQPLADSLTGFVDVLLPKLTNALNSSGMIEFAEKLKTAFIGIGSAIGEFIQILADNGGRLGGVIQTISQNFQVLLPAVARFIVALSAAPEQLGKFTEGIASFLDALGSSMERAFQTKGFEDFMSGVQRGLTTLGEAIGIWVETAAQHGAEFGTAFEAVAQVFKDTAAPMAEFMAAGAQVLPTVLQGITDGINTVLPALQQFMTVWAQASPAVIQSLADVVAALLQKLSEPQMVAGMQQMIDAFAQLAIAVINSGLLETVVELGTSFANLLTSMLPIIQVVLNMAAGFMQLQSIVLDTASYLAGGGLIKDGIDMIGTAWSWVTDKFKSDSESAAEDTKTAFEVAGEAVQTTAASIAQQAANMYAQVAAEHGQMKDGVLTDWTSIGQYADQINNGIGTAAENAQTRVDAAAAAADASWAAHMATVQSTTSSVFDVLTSGSEAAASAVAAQAERMAADATAGAAQGKEGITSNMEGAQQGTKSAFDGMSSESQATWSKIVADAATGTSNMNTTSSAAWDALGQHIKSTLDQANAAVKTSSETAAKDLVSAPEKGAQKWGEFPGKVQTAANSAASSVQSACNQMTAALNAVTSKTYVINIQVNTTKVVTEIQQAASSAVAAAGGSPTGPIGYAASFDAGEFRASVASAVGAGRAGGATHEEGRNLLKALERATHAIERQADSGARSQNVTVNARTDANPFEIGREVAWAMRGM
ncbi:hypothetical protein ACFYYS_00240 [Streptomyces sp. NPDC002120]|uniref:hypothetical protein n=1 Tax=Streptomyces sp. NPDC002120 TaxID=3364631 RepID=UPI0036C1EDEF